MPQEASPSNTDEASNALSVRVLRVQIDGGLPSLEGAGQSLIKTLVGRDVTLGEIRRQIGLLERAYRQHGFFLVRVALPPQHLRDGGELRIVVIDGFIEKVDASGVPARVQAAVVRMLEPLVGRRGLTLKEVEQRVRVAGSMAGLRLQSALAAGEQPGGSQLLLEGKQHSTNVGFSIDNDQPRAIGSQALLLNLSLNSLMGAGERFYLALGSGSQLHGWENSRAPLTVAGAGVVAPMGIDGWTLNPEFTQTTTNPTPEPDAVRTRGRLSRASLRLTTPRFNTRNLAGGGHVALEHVAQRQDAVEFGVPLSDDRYDALRLGLNTSMTPASGGTTVAASAEWSQGLGGRRQGNVSEPPLSRLGAAPTFRRLGAVLRLTQPIVERLNLEVLAAGQTSFGDPLLVSEQFALSGPDHVSGHASGSLPVDEGGTLRGELLLSLPASVNAGVQAMAVPYVFAAAGRGRLIRPTLVEQASLSSQSAGLGLRAVALGADGAQGQLTLELARLMGTPDEDRRRWHFSVRLSVSE